MAIENLLEVDPIGDPMPQVLRASGRERSFDRRRDVYNMQIVVANESHRAAVGAELGIRFVSRMVRQPHGDRAIERGVIEVVVVREEETLVSGIHVEEHPPGDRLRGLVVDGGQPLQALGQSDGIDKGAGPAGRGLNLEQLALANLQPVRAIEPSAPRREIR